MIRRVSAPDGHPVEDLTKLRETVGEMLSSAHSSGIRIVTLAPGEYDLTPQIWTRNSYTHHVTVLNDGTANYKMLPKHHDSELFECSDREIIRKVGGKIIRIFDGQPVTFVSGGHPTKPGLNIFELILHAPGVYR